MRTLRLSAGIGVGALVIGALTLGAPSADAAGKARTIVLDNGVVVPALSTQRSDDEDAAFRESLMRMAGAGATDAEIEAALGIVRVSSATLDDAVPGRASHDNYKRLSSARSLSASSGDTGMVAAAASAAPKDIDMKLNTLRGDKIQICGGSGPYHLNKTDSPNSLTLGTPAFYWSTGSEYYVLAGWNWTAEATYYDLNCGHKIGGYDGFGILIDKSVTNLGTSLAACFQGDCSYKMHTQFVTESNEHGAAWRFQDIAYYTGQGNKQGVETFRLKFQQSGCTQASSKYGHSWSNTSLTGVSVGPYSLGLYWSSSENNFAKAPSTTGKRSC